MPADLSSRRARVHVEDESDGYDSGSNASLQQLSEEELDDSEAGDEEAQLHNGLHAI